MNEIQKGESQFEYFGIRNKFENMAKKQTIKETSNDFEKFLEEQQEANPHFSLETIKLLWERENSQTTNEQE